MRVSEPLAVASASDRGEYGQEEGSELMAQHPGIASRVGGVNNNDED